MDQLLDDQNCTEQEQDEESLQCENYRLKIVLSKQAISSFVNKKSPSSSPVGSEFGTATEGGTRRERSFKLPKIELKTFNGDLREWLQFWSQFEKIDKDDSLHPSDKFQYLIQAMEIGTEAREMVTTFPATGDNYPKAVQSLKDRYGNESLLLQVYMKELLKLVIHNATQKEALLLSKMYLKLESHLQALTTLHLETADPSSWLYPLVESSLPEEILRAWQRSPLSKRSKDDKTSAQQSPLDNLREFLKEEVENEQKIALAQSGFDSKGTSGRHKKSVHSRSKPHSTRENVPTASALFTGGKSLCIFCDKSHESGKCGRAQSMTLQEKTQLVRDKNGCLACLKRNHWVKSCKKFVKCPLCDKKHEILMCPELPKHKNKEKTTSEVRPTKDETQQSAAYFAGSSIVYLGTFRTVIVNGNRKLEVRALLDSGAQRSYLSSRTARKLNLRPIGEEKICHSLFGGVNTSVKSLKSYNVKSLQPKGGYTHLNVLETETICGNIPKLPAGPWIKILRERNISVSDLNTKDDQQIDLMIGADYYAQLMTGRIVKLTPGLTALETTFGWVVMGSSEENGRKVNSNLAMNVINMFVAEDSSPEQLWSLETIGIRDPADHKTRVERERATQEHFSKTVSRSEDGRYIVRLPWIGNSMEIPDNKKVAKARLNSATSKLLQNNKLENYNAIFLEWTKEGIIKEVSPLTSDPSATHYLPHRPVFKESKTTPVRPVFDASCKVGRNPSLNDCLEKGPNLIELIPAILLRFRERRLGVISDIRKAFQMIEIHEDDQDFLRFLWWEDSAQEKEKIYKHCRVVFGVNCSPYLLGAVLEHHLNTFTGQTQFIAQKVLKSMYVDNCVTSVDNYEEYEQFKSISTKMLAEAKMDLREWEHTSMEISSSTTPDQDLTSVLGYKWDKSLDSIRCDFDNKKTELPRIISKRVILSKVQQVFDPLGFFSPAMIKSKLLLQKA